MNRWVISTVALTLLATFALGQSTANSTSYPIPGVSQTAPLAPPASLPVVTRPETKIPMAPPFTPLVMMAPLTQLPLTQPVPPPIEPDPATRLARTMTWPSHGSAMVEARELTNNKGVQDGTYGRSLGEIARDYRATPRKRAGQSWTNDNLERNTPLR